MQQDETAAFTDLSSKQEQELIDAGKVYVIDVRERSEWDDTGHIKGATLVPLNTFLRKPREYLQQGEGVLFYCAMGQRSAVAAEMASAIGLRQVYNLDGGITDWRAHKLPLER